MPNSRRRRFSVKHSIVLSNSKKQSDAPSSISENNQSKISSQGAKPSKSKNKLSGNNSKQAPQLDLVVECDSSPSKTVTVTRRATCDRDVTAASSNIDFYNILTLTEDYCDDTLKPMLDQMESEKRDLRNRRDKYPLRQHRVKVRSPRRRASIADEHITEQDNRTTVGTDVIDWDQEVEERVLVNVVNMMTTDPAADVQPSNHSIEDMCRICHGGEALSPDLGQMISACGCRGTVGRVHVKCLERWLTESGKSRCELCGTRYATQRVHRYGFPKALAIWILSQNAKQLMVDSLGIMLMSPLAVMAAWLSGRTLAGLMTPDTHPMPWPLASTFVLACMTLVCYYCWIVSAVTRHALGWWIWYRAQYEVRLQFQENEE